MYEYLSLDFNLFNNSKLFLFSFDLPLIPICFSMHGIPINIMIKLAKNDLFRNIPQYIRKIKLIIINIGKSKPNNDIGQKKVGFMNGDI